jgi:DNA-binding SARP family transcriptional activator
MNDAPLWRLFVLGGFRLVAPERPEMSAGDKQLELLAYLALEGTATRSRLGGLLWPQRAEHSARKQPGAAPQRMRGAFGEDLVVGQEALALAPQVEVDVGRVSGRRRPRP